MHNWTASVEQAVAFRREMHQHPEIAWNEHRTAERIRLRLDDAGIPWQSCAGTGTIARLAPHVSGRPHRAFRADIDALALDEHSGSQWASTNAGCMHACGHDGHSATALLLALWLKSVESELNAPVSIFFQPAEEGGHGAREMIADGALVGIDEIYGWHNWPGIPFGQAVCPDGPVMAANGTFRIRLRGQGGHASQPEYCRDPVLAGSAINLALQQIVARRMAPQQAVVVSLTSFVAPSSDTTIPDTAEMRGCIRLSDSDLRNQVNDQIVQIARDTARGYGVDAEVDIYPRYQATINWPEQAQRYRQALLAELGADWLSRDTLIPIMASEDFSYYLREIPGAYALIGGGDTEHHEPLHSPRYDFNDALIAPVVRTLSRLTEAPLPE